MKLRLVVGLLAIVGIIAASVVLFGLWAWWTHELIYTEHNYLAVGLLIVLGIVGAFAIDLWDDGEITFSKTRRWRPKWAQRQPISRADAPILDLSPDEFRREHRE